MDNITVSSRTRETGDMDFKSLLEYVTFMSNIQMATAFENLKRPKINQLKTPKNTFLKSWTP